MAFAAGKGSTRKTGLVSFSKKQNVPFFISIMGMVLSVSSPAQERPSPPDGWTPIDCQGTCVKIFRDRFGVPHIYANSKKALFFAFGYTTAQNRIAQLEFYRRAARGELAEVLGLGGSDIAPSLGSIVDEMKPRVLDADRTIRQMAYTEAEREEQFGQLREETRALFIAYADGVNRWMQEIEGDPSKTPDEIRRFAIRLRPWKATDSIAIFHAAMHRFGLFGGRELRNLQFLKDLGEKEFNRKYPINHPDSPTTISGPLPRGKKADLHWPLYERIANHIAPRIEGRRTNLLRVFERIGFPAKYGSFVALIARKRSATGHTLFLSCPQMKFYRPSILHEVALHGAGFDVAGVAFPGAPLVILGRNRTVVWGLTAGHADNADIFVEELNRDNPLQYRFNGQWRDFESREEVFQVKDSAPVRERILRSVHGPVIETDPKSRLAYTCKYTFWMKEHTAIEAFLDLAPCAAPEQFRAACRRVSLSFNLFYADAEGRIGFQFCGLYRIPAEGVDVRLPVSGTGDNEWRGIIPFDDLPHQFDPPKGYFANWNNKPSPDWDNGDNLPWTGHNTVYWITDIIDEHPTVSFDTVRDIPRQINTHGSYEQIVELSRPEFRAFNILPPGQCGFIAEGGKKHPHLDDQQKIADEWQHKAWEWIVSPDSWSDK